MLVPQKVDVANQSGVRFNINGNDKGKNKRQEYRIEGPCFARYHTQPRPYFTIHPEWASETLYVRGTSIKEKKNKSSINNMLPPPTGKT